METAPQPTMSPDVVARFREIEALCLSEAEKTSDPAIRDAFLVRAKEIQAILAGLAKLSPRLCS